MDHVFWESCPCNPTSIPVRRGDGSVGWVHAHHEPGEGPAGQADRAARIVEAMAEVDADWE